jgi:hypothetical protein
MLLAMINVLAPPAIRLRHAAFCGLGYATTILFVAHSRLACEDDLGSWCCQHVVYPVFHTARWLMAKGRIDVAMSPAEMMGGNVTRVSLSTRDSSHPSSPSNSSSSNGSPGQKAHVLSRLQSMRILEPAALQRSNSGEED